MLVVGLLVIHWQVQGRLCQEVTGAHEIFLHRDIPKIGTVHSAKLAAFPLTLQHVRVQDLR